MQLLPYKYVSDVQSTGQQSLFNYMKHSNTLYANIAAILRGIASRKHS